MSIVAALFLAVIAIGALWCFATAFFTARDAVAEFRTSGLYAAWVPGSLAGFVLVLGIVFAAILVAIVTHAA